MINILNTFYIYLIVVIIISALLLVLNIILSTHTPDINKLVPFECGFLSYSQTRTPFSIAFYLVGILFMLFDLEILYIYPYSVSSYHLELYGLTTLIIFVCILTLGFVFEINKGALKLTGDSNQ